MIKAIGRRDSTLIVALALALALLVCGFVGFEVWRTHEGALGLARTRAETLARVLDEQTRSAVRAVDLSLSGFADALRVQPSTASHDHVFTQRLRSRVKELPYVRAFFVVGADGFIIQDSDLDTPHRNLADRDYFRVHADTPDAGVFIGQPLRSRSSGSPWFLSMSRRITLDDGTFYGVAVAALEPRYFAQFYSTIEVGDGGFVGLFHRDGLMIARHPHYEEAIGTSFAGDELIRDRLSASAAGTYTSVNPIDAVERIFSYRSLPPLPLVVGVGISTETALGEWRKNAAAAGVGVGGCLLLFAVGTFVIVRQRRREQSIAERLQQIDKAESLGQITSGVAHDFNNLLTVITGNLEIAAARVSDDALRRRLSNALSAADRGTRLVGQLLAFARRKPVAAAVESLSELLLQIEDLLRQAAAPADLSLRLHEVAWPCEIDRSEFERAVLNLVVNARDSAPKAGILIELRNIAAGVFDPLSWPELAPGDYVECRISDDGAGMSPAVLRRACEPFFTTKTEGKGTGLGLAQVYGFARQSGGSVKIESALGIGTSITILLPRAASPHANGADATEPDTRSENPQTVDAG